ncbi:MAG: hypothetical protein H0T72_12330, partial [Chloroflexia bacterium]|nr:hypothetical protein [Chloroflexia bacterium]
MTQQVYMTQMQSKPPAGTTRSTMSTAAETDAYNWPAAPATRAGGRLLPWLDWKFSLLVPVALLLIVATALWQVASRPELIDLTVHNGSTGETIPGARVVIDGLTYASGDDGTVTF